MDTNRRRADVTHVIGRRCEKSFVFTDYVIFTILIWLRNVAFTVAAAARAGARARARARRNLNESTKYAVTYRVRRKNQWFTR